MLTSFPVRCPHAGCAWTDDLMPSRTPGGPAADIEPWGHGWFRCPRCGQDWEGEIRDDRVLVLEPVAAQPH